MHWLPQGPGRIAAGHHLRHYSAIPFCKCVAQPEQISYRHVLCDLQSIVKCISEPEVGQSEHLPLLQELLDAVMVTTQQTKQECQTHSLQLFTIILRVSASNHAESLGTKVHMRMLGASSRYSPIARFSLLHLALYVGSLFCGTIELSYIL